MFTQYNAAPRLENDELIFEANYNNNEVGSHIVSIRQFDASKDMEGVATHVPHMEHFFDNSLQSGLMRDMAVDLEMLGEYLVLLGNQVSFTLLFSFSSLFFSSYLGLMYFL